MDSITTIARAQEWASLIADANASGLTRKEWCSSAGVSIHALYYWQRKLRKAAFDQSEIPSPVTFAELPSQAVPASQTSPAAGSSSVILRTKSASLELSCDLSADVLAMIRDVMIHAS